jgi:integrative and conjugative element protein (TIGR02256 family)
MWQTVIHIYQPALDLIGHVARDSGDGLETGGILLGHDVGELVEVTVAGGPGPAAIRQRTRFRRDIAYAQQLSDDAFEADGSVWLGEWHTHPTGLATPSALDHRSYAEMLADTELGFTQFLCFIVTPGQDAWGTPLLWPWVVHPGGFVHAAAAEVVARGHRPDAVERGSTS